MTNVGVPTESQILDCSNGAKGGAFAATVVLSFAGFFFALGQSVFGMDLQPVVR